MQSLRVDLRLPRTKCRSVDAFPYLYISISGIRLLPKRHLSMSQPAITAAISIHGREIIELVIAHPQGIHLHRLTELVTTRYGESARFKTCTTRDMTLDNLLALLVLRHKVSIVRDVAFPGSSPICSHCRTITPKPEPQV